jgi:hypothetical protein
VSKTINLTLKVWRQEGPEKKGRLETYPAKEISTDMSFLEMIDVINEQLTLDGKEPIAFDHDCREGICGMCGAVVNGHAHGPEKGTTLCQLHMRHFSDGDTIVVEPWRARAFKVIKDLNPEIRGHFLAPGNHSILIPKCAADGFHHRFKTLLDQWIATARQRIYVVRQGDNLSTISQRFDVPLPALVIWNHLENKKHIHPGDELVIYPGEIVSDEN